MDIKDLTETFDLLGDWEERFRYLIDLGEKLPSVPDALKTEENRIKGCLSQVWMVAEWDEAGRLNLRADSDAKIVRGLIAVLYSIFSGKTRDDIASTDVEKVFKTLGLDQHLSPNRRNGFFSMVERLRVFVATSPDK